MNQKRDDTTDVVCHVRMSTVDRVRNIKGIKQSFQQDS